MKDCRIALPLLLLLAGIPAQAQHTEFSPAGTTTTAPARDTATKAAPTALAVTTAGATIRLNGLVQVWFVDDARNAPTTFRLRRAELKLSGRIDERVKYTLMLDAAKAIGATSRADTAGGRVQVTTSVSQASRILQDASLEIELGRFAVEAGQTKLPIGLEAGLSSGQLPVVERGAFISDKARGGGIAFTREVGIVVRTKLLGASATVGAFNGFGESMGSTDRAGGKVVLTRLVAGGAGPVQLGASAAVDAASDSYRDRLGADAVLRAHGWRLQLEALRAHENGVSSGGAYSQLTRGYRALEGVARVDVWDPDLNAELATATRRHTDLLLGFTWKATPSVRAQFNVVQRHLDGEVENRFYSNLQTSW